MVITVSRDTLPEAWEEAIIRCWNEGDRVRTEYDKPEDPDSRDCTLVMNIRHPMQEPRIHKAFPGSLESLEIYRQEVVEGVHDHWIKPDEGKWSYTYHQRLFAYPAFLDNDNHRYFTLSQGCSPDFKWELREGSINQMQYVVDKLVEAPHTRRAQAIVWNPKDDINNEHCACLQRVWFRIFGNELRMNSHMRSNDGFLATGMNCWAFIDLMRWVADRYFERTGTRLEIGEYCHMVDSFHIYGSRFGQFEGFLESAKKRPISERVWRSDDPMVQQCFDSARLQLEEEKRLKK